MLRPFVDHADAAQRLTAALRARHLTHPMVVALLPQGARIARQVGDAIRAPVDGARVALLALEGTFVGAMDDEDGDCVTVGHVPEATIHLARTAATKRFGPLREACPGLFWRGREVVLVDDGAATGSAMRLAIRQARRQGAARVIVALPVAPRGVAERLAALADDCLILEIPEHLHDVADAYATRDALSDDDVRRSLDLDRTPRPVGARRR